MSKKFYSSFVFIILAAVLLVACQAATITSEADCTSAEVFCVGLVTGLEGIQDKALNQSAWDGVLRAESEKVADRVRYIETVDAKDYDQNITSLALAGYDVILTVGEQYSGATARLAKNYPNSEFIGVDQNQAGVSPNLAGLVFEEDKIGFLAGALAAQLTKTGTIAGIFGSETATSRSAIREGYEAGARYINPNIKVVSTSYPEAVENAFTDPRWGVDTAARTIQNGADVVFAPAGRTGDGALIETAQIPGAFCIGVDIDQWETLPDARTCLVSSAIKLVSQGVFDMVKLTRAGNLPPGNYPGSTGLAPYHDFDSLLPQTIKDKNAQITNELAKGTVNTGFSQDK